MRAHRNVERRLNRERLVPVLSASTLSSDFIPYPLVSSLFLANNCPFLLGCWKLSPTSVLERYQEFPLSLFSFLFLWFFDLIMSDRRKILRNRKIRNVDTFARFIHQRISRIANSLSVDLPPPSPCKNTWQGDEFHRRWRKGKKRKEGKENVEICFHRGRKRNLQLETR